MLCIIFSGTDSKIEKERLSASLDVTENVVSAQDQQHTSGTDLKSSD